MAGRRDIALLGAIALSLVSVSARAAVPSPSNSIIPTHISLVGTSAGISDPAGGFTVFDRDLTNLPVAGSLIVVDLSGCPDAKLCSLQYDNCVPLALSVTGVNGGGEPPHDTCEVVDCATKTVRKFTGLAGTATFRIVGNAFAVPGTPGSPANCASIYADGIRLGNVPVSMYDLNGGGVGPSDLSNWLMDFFGPYNPQRADYNGNGHVDPADLSSWLIVFFNSGSTSGCSATCP